MTTIATTVATYKTLINADFPDWASNTIYFTLSTSVAISGAAEIFPRSDYTMTLDANGVKTDFALPTPDNDGTSAWTWVITLPDGRQIEASIAYDASDQDLSDILASATTAADPDVITAALASKVSKTGDTMTGDLTMSAASIISADTISFNTSYTETGSETKGTRFWNSAKGTTTLITSSGSALDDGQELRYYGKASGDVANGEPVQFAGSQGDHVLFKSIVPSEIKANPKLFMGVATESISNGSFGNVTAVGYVNDISTSGWSIDDLLWLDFDTGTLTNVEPIVGTERILVAAVVKEETGSAENGIILVRPTWDSNGTVPKDAAILSKSGAYEVAAGDEAKIIECDGTFTVTFPDGLDEGFQVVIVNVGSGTITLAAATTLQGEGTQLATQYTGATVYHRGSNVWMALGKLT